MAFATAAATGKVLYDNFGFIQDINPFATKEKGSGLTQSNTLAHAIDKLDKANDYEAIQAADKIKREIAMGETNKNVFFNIIESDLGYPLNSIQGSRKADYINQMIDQLLTEQSYQDVERERSMLASATQAGPVAVMPGLDGRQWVLIAGLGGLVFWLLQQGRK